MNRLLLRLTFFAVCLLMAGEMSGAVRYIATSGSDSNDGTTKTTPWLHAPGMTGCLANCAAYTPQPGDQIIFRGGDTWHFSGPGVAGLPWRWIWNGTAASRIYVGVDLTFFTGAAWARPIFTGDNPASSANVGSCVNPFFNGDFNSNNMFLLGAHGSFTTFDNLEFQGICTNCGTTGCGAGGNGPTMLLAGGSNHIYDHLYFHNQTKTAAGQVTDQWALSGDNTVLNQANVEVRNTVFDFGDSNYLNAMGAAINGVGDFIHHNVFTHLCNAYLGGSFKEFHDNLEDDVAHDDPQLQAHCNPLEPNSGDPGGSSVFNNIFRHIVSTSGILCTSPSSGVDKWYNNIFWDVALGLIICDPLTGRTGTAGAVIENNTILGVGGTNYCINIATSPLGTLIIRNNHCISDNNGPRAGDAAGVRFTVSASQPALVEVNNLLRTQAQAAADGYTSSQQFVFSPFGARNQVTIGGGLNLTGSCSGPLTALCNDTTYGGVTYDAVNHKVVLGARATNSRPATSPPNWDVGAYQFGGVRGPAPPSNLNAMVQ